MMTSVTQFSAQRTGNINNTIQVNEADITINNIVVVRLFMKRKERKECTMD